MTWFKRFAVPIALADGGKLLTLQDAADYIRTLTKAEREAAHWVIAMEALTLVAERNGAEMLARITVQIALNDGKPPPLPEPRRKAAKLRIIQ
jgi:hypothetical protein